MNEPASCGGGRIRTYVSLTTPRVFETRLINHSKHASWRPRRESNPHYEIRNLEVYPLAYGDLHAHFSIEVV